MTLKDAFEKRKSDLVEFKENRRKIRPVIKGDDKIPEGLYEKCPSCATSLHVDQIKANDFVCPSCDEHLRVRSVDRITLTADKYSFKEYGSDYVSKNPLGIEKYEEKLGKLRHSNGINEAYVYGTARIKGEKCVIGVMDSYFLMGSMGSVVGEKVTKTFELAQRKNLPVVLFTASGGARMQEGIYSLMQMAKTSTEIAKFSEGGGLYITVLTHPTTGGVTASFATLGDIILAEPKALIGFAGPRVIEQTINQKLPEGFQRSEFLLEKGFIDKVVPRKELKEMLGTLLKLHRRSEA